MFLPVWNYLKGYVIIKASGLSAGKFVNMAAFYGIDLWDIKNDGKSYYMKAELSAEDELREISRKSGSRTEIIKRRGFPCIAARLKKRKAYVLGAVFFIAAIYALSGFVWTVQVDGNYRVPTEDIRSFCRENGLFPGTVKKSVDTTVTADKLIASFEDISWAAVTVKGTKAVVSVSETIPETEIIDNSTPCDIISEYDGVIESITVINGTPKVRAGDVVKKGDILVSGCLEIKDGDEIKGERYVKSEAYIRAQTVHKVILEVNMTEKSKEYTGGVSKSFKIEAGDFSRELSLWQSPENYEKTVNRDFRLNIGEYHIPFGITVYDLKEYVLKDRTMTEEEARQKARDFLAAYEEEHFGMDAYIIKEETDGKVDGQSYRYTALITVSQKIGAEAECAQNNNPEVKADSEQ
ncbi:sporulation protein YqfD [Lachnospiraceae bacterium NSJ-143]|nr:sporulation protein YqfD [Lachnospiraceae bacterium NSJ-143]